MNPNAQTILTIKIYLCKYALFDFNITLSSSDHEEDVNQVFENDFMLKFIILIQNICSKYQSSFEKHNRSDEYSTPGSLSFDLF